MKNVMRVLSVAALSAAFTLPALAQDAAAPAAAAAAPNICTEDARTELYTKYFNEKKTDQAAAFATGKTYLEKYASCNDNYTAAVKKFVDAYGTAKLRLDTLKAVDGKDWTTAYRAGAEYLALNPNDLQVITILGYSGIEPSNSANSAAALGYSKKAIQMLEAGQSPEAWAPFKGKDHSLAYLYYAIGELSLGADPTEAAKAFIRTSQIESDLKKQPAIYARLGTAYAVSQYNPLLADLQKYAGKDKTPESELAFENFYGAADRVIDAFARAVALSTDAKDKAAAMEKLTAVYKSRNNDSDAGLTELIAGVMSKPLPEPFVPSTTPAPAATPVTGSTTPATGATVSGTTATATPTPAKPVTTPTEAPKPAEPPNKTRKP